MALLEPDRIAGIVASCREVYPARRGRGPGKQPSHAVTYTQRRATLDALKAGPCADCGETFPPECMDFDHVRGIKEFNVGRGVTGMSLARLEAEIAKCELVCANCHRTRTKNRRLADA